MYSIIEIKGAKQEEVTICERETEAQAMQAADDYFTDQIRTHWDYKSYDHEIELIVETPEGTRKEWTLEVFA